MRDATTKALRTSCALRTSAAWSGEVRLRVVGGVIKLRQTARCTIVSEPDHERRLGSFREFSV
jgi:hypothetical protein